MKCVFVIDPTLPRGLVANTAAVLAMSVGARNGQLIGHDTPDADGLTHPGITCLAVPMLQADRSRLAALHRQALELRPRGLFVAGFNTVAQGTGNYTHYSERMRGTASADLDYLGLALLGPAKLVGSLTGSLPLLR